MSNASIGINSPCTPDFDWRRVRWRNRIILMRWILGLILKYTCAQMKQKKRISAATLFRCGRWKIKGDFPARSSFIHFWRRCQLCFKRVKREKDDDCMRSKNKSIYDGWTCAKPSQMTEKKDASLSVCIQ